MSSPADRARALAGTVVAVLRILWRASPLLLTLTVVLSIALGLLPVLVIVATSVLLELLTEPAGDGTLPAVMLLALGALALASILAKICERVAGVVQHLHATRATHHVQLLVAGRAARVPYPRFEDRAFHNLMQTAMTQSSQRLPALLGQVNSAIATGITVVSLGGVLLAWNPLVLLVLLVTSALGMRIATAIAVRRVRMIVGRAELERERLYLADVLTDDQAAKEVRSFDLGDHLLGRMASVMERIYGQERSLARREVALWAGAGTLLALVQPLLLGYAALGVVQGAFGIGRFNLYAQAILQGDGLLTQLGGIVASIHESHLFARQLLDFLDATGDAAPAGDGEGDGTAAGDGGGDGTAAVPATGSLGGNGTRPPRPPRLEVDDVWFTYPRTDVAVLRGLTLHVDPGEVLALVGRNGAGKTTLVKLLLGLYEPDRGSIRLDGTDLRELPREHRLAAFATILQDFTIYHLAAHDNVWFGDVSRPLDQQRLEEVARASGLDRVLARLPHGPDTVLGKYWRKGHELSGGQRQLVALARGLYRDAPVLILDEPSAALDPVSERRFFDLAVGGTTSGPPRTTLLISHRLSTVRRAGRVVVMDGGRVVEAGTHHDLLHAGGHYAALYDDADPAPPERSAHP